MSKGEPRSADSSIKRRTVLKGAGAAAGVYTLGASGFTGAAAAQTAGSTLYTITPSTDVFEGEAEGEYASDSDWEDAFYNYGIRNQKLLILDELGNVDDQIPLDPQNVANVVADPTVGDEENQVIQVATLSYNPADDLLYGIAHQFGSGANNLTRTDTDQTGRFVFTLDPSNGELNLVGGPNNQLKNMWGSTFDTDGSTFYGQTGGLGNHPNSLFTIDVDTVNNTTTVNLIGDVESKLTDTADPGIEHTGLSWNKLAPSFNIVGVLGNFTTEPRDDLIEINPDLFDARVAVSNVFASGELVSTAFNPCIGGDPTQARIFSIRNGNQFFSADVENPAVDQTDATITAGPDTLMVVDNLAEKPTDCVLSCTRTIGYWKNHAGKECPSLKSVGPKKKDTIYSVLDDCGGIIVGTDEDNIYGGSDDLRFDDDDVVPNYEYDLEADCDDIAVIVDVLEGAQAEDIELMLLAQLLAAKLNVCNGATVQDGVGGNITTTIAEADEYFSNLADGEQTRSREELEMLKDILDGYNNQNVALACDDE